MGEGLAQGPAWGRCSRTSNWVVRRRGEQKRQKGGKETVSSRGRPLRSKLPARAGGGGRIAAGSGAGEKDATNFWRLAGCLLIKGGGAKGGVALGAGPAFLKGMIINCSRGLHSTSEDKKQLRDGRAGPGRARCTPFAAHPRRALDPDPAVCATRS